MKFCIPEFQSSKSCQAVHLFLRKLMILPSYLKARRQERSRGWLIPARSFDTTWWCISESNSCTQKTVTRDVRKRNEQGPSVAIVWLVTNVGEPKRRTWRYRRGKEKHRYILSWHIISLYWTSTYVYDYVHLWGEFSSYNLVLPLKTDLPLRSAKAMDLWLYAWKV